MEPCGLKASSVESDRIAKEPLRRICLRAIVFAETLLGSKGSREGLPSFSVFDKVTEDAILAMSKKVEMYIQTML